MLASLPIPHSVFIILKNKFQGAQIIELLYIINDKSLMAKPWANLPILPSSLVKFAKLYATKLIACGFAKLSSFTVYRTLSLKL